jgi:hypothetical protein
MPAAIFSKVDLPEPLRPDQRDLVALRDAQRRAIEERRSAEGQFYPIEGEQGRRHQKP